MVGTGFALCISEGDAKAEQEAAPNGIVRSSETTARLGRRDAHGSRGLYVVRVDAERRPATRTMLLIQ